MSKATLRKRTLSVFTRPVPEPPRVPEAALILGALPVPVVLLNGDDRFVYVNQAAEQFLGISAAQLAPMRVTDLFQPDSPLLLLIAYARRGEVTVADHDLTLESQRLHKPGIAIQITPVLELPGAVLLVMQDASAARALDRQLSFRGAARSVSGMAAVLAHEVKNPLSGIRGAAQVLEASVAESDRELTLLIRDEADRIRDLVDRMELFGEKAIERQAVNIHRVLEHVRKLAQSGFAAHIRFSEVYDPSLPPVWGNRDQLVQTLLNLVKNAAEAITDAENPHGEIVLATAFQHGRRVAIPGSQTRVDLPLIVTVRDNGPGIPEDLRPHLFEPFVTSKSSGNGLGLALVAKIVGDHGGLIEVDSRPGRTEFRLHLPVVVDKDSDGP